MAKRRERNKEKTRAAILKAATLIFSKKGFKGTSLHDIELASRVSKGLILHHFGSKEKLYRAVHESLNKDYAASLLKLGPVPYRSKMSPESVIRTALSYTKGNDDFRRVALWSYLEGKDRALETGKRIVETLVRAVKEGQAAGFLRKDIDARIMPFVIKGTIDFWIQQAPLVEQIAKAGPEGPPLNDEALVSALAALMKA